MLGCKSRAALAGDAFHKWDADFLLGHRLHVPEYRLWLTGSFALYGVEKAILAPNYPSNKGRAT